MKVIDICEDYGGKGCLKKYYKENNIKDFSAISLGMYLSIGDIKKDHLSFIKELIDNEYDYSSELDKIIRESATSKIRIWSSKTNADDYLLLLYLCNMLKDKKNKISVIFTTDYKKDLLSLTALDYKEVPLILKHEKELTETEINQYANEWKELIKINSELRVIESNTIKNKKYSDYDETILKILKETGPCSLVDLIGILMANYIMGDASSIVYEYLINRLISDNKIKITKKSEKHFEDIIEHKEFIQN